MDNLEHKIVWDDQKVSRLWKYYSRTEPYADMYFSKQLGKRILRSSKIPVDEPIRVLDFGCGPGYLWDHVQSISKKWIYTGLDFSPDSVDALNKRASGHAQFSGAQHISRLPSRLPAGSFDAVFLFEVIEHLNDDYLDQTMQEIFRLLAPGGVVVVTTPNNEDLAQLTRFCPDCGAVFHQWQHVRSWTSASLAECFAKYGMRLNFCRLSYLTNRSAFIDFAKSIIFRFVYARKSPPNLLAVFQKTVS